MPLLLCRGLRWYVFVQRCEFFGCSKIIEDKQDDLLVQIITDGRWKVSSYVEDTTDYSAGFEGYEFQFRDNKTVDAIKNGEVERSGTWQASLANMTIESQFEGSALLTLLNGTWMITKNSWTYVEAKQTHDGKQKNLRLDKL